MWELIVTFASLGCVFPGLCSGIEELSHRICRNVNKDDFVPNPYDCRGFFVCGAVPSIKYCDPGLHFDVKTKLCLPPERTKCEIQKFSDLNNSNNSLAQPNPYYVSEETTKAKPKGLSLSFKPPILVFTATDVETNKAIDPMTNYDPLNINCHHYGAYFLPHPTDCASYYVCAFGHMLQHTCGHGTVWSYKRQVCEIQPIAECYNSFPSSEDIIQAEKKAESNKMNQAHGKPPVGGVYTVCYRLNNDLTELPTWVPLIATQTEYARPPSTMTEISSSGDRVNEKDTERLICSKSDEVFLPHATDCSKYYICIIGMPVLTSCPDGLYWNQKTDFCDSPSNVECPRSLR